MPEFRLPDLGEGLTEAQIITWHVGPGDQVEVDQVVVEVETAKAAVEVPVPYAGTVSELHAEAGQSVTVGAPLISIGSLDDASPGSAHSPQSNGSGNVLIGYGTSESAKRRARGRRRRPAAPEALSAGAQSRAAGATQSKAPPGGSITVVSPLVRTMAREAEIDLRVVRGSGASGLILRRDVEQAIRNAANDRSGADAAPDDAAPSTTPALSPPSTATPDNDEIRLPLRGARRAAVDELTRSRREIPEATVWVDVDATDLLGARASLNADSERPVSVLALIARFAVIGLRRFREMNARVIDDEIVLTSRVGLGFAAQTRRGLVVPVVQRAQELSARQLSASIGDLARRARDGETTPADLSGGTFTVNNYGVWGVDGSAAIINHPEAAMLGIGRIVDKPWVVDGQVTVRKITELTLAFDHRVCDGDVAGGFLRFVADCVERPLNALAEL